MDAELKLARGAILSPLKIQFLSKTNLNHFICTLYESLKIVRTILPVSPCKTLKRDP